ncbi:MAG: hypothetical protein ACLVCH_01220 [Roseburia inulinivorans]
MEQNLLTKKKLKEKSIEYQIPFANLLEVFLQETLMFQILETDFAKRLWLKNREAFDLDSYRKEWQKPLYFVYGQDDGKEQQVLDEKWITSFCRGDLCKTGTTYPLELFSGKRGTGLSGLHNRRMGRDEGSACNSYQSIGLSCRQNRKNKSCSQSFLRRSVQYISIFRLRHIWQSDFFYFKVLELIPSMEVYDTTFRLLEQETVDGRHIYETLSFCVETRK